MTSNNKPNISGSCGSKRDFLKYHLVPTLRLRPEKALPLACAVYFVNGLGDEVFQTFSGILQARDFHKVVVTHIFSIRKTEE